MNDHWDKWIRDFLGKAEVRGKPVCRGKGKTRGIKVDEAER